jgi:hypothetical protein
MRSWTKRREGTVRRRSSTQARGSIPRPASAGGFLQLCCVLVLAAGLELAADSAQPPPPTAPLATPPRGALPTNSPTATARLTKTNAPARTGSPAGTNTVATKSSGTNALSSTPGTFDRLKASPAFYPVIIGVAVCALALVLVRGLRAGRKKPVTPSSIVSKAGAKALQPKAGAATVHACNVLEIGKEARQLWQFEARGSTYTLNREHTALGGEPLQPGLVAKNWRSLFYRKLNIAWLPPEHVFLRAAQFPRSDFNETLSMVELQLEKFSPMPVAQIVWSIQILPHAEGNLQTVIVMIVARNIVEEFLGKLESQGYLADRLELPLLDQLQTTAITEDGAWIYPEAGGGKNAALVAWWYGGVLQSLDLLMLPAGKDTVSLKEQLTQMAWAGELEGWLSAPPNWHLVADAVVASEWEPLLREGLDQPLDVSTPLAARELAALTARRSATSDPRANLMPVEYALRYQQQFVDRLWMRGLLAVAGIYALGVLVYMVALAWVNYQTGSVETQVVQTGASYTNALQLKARYQVLKDRQELKYAALDCWNTAAHFLPEGVVIESLNFSQGKRFTLSGSAPADASTQLNNFESDLRKATINGQLLFDPNKGDTINYRVQGSSATWSLTLELKRAEVQ